MKSKIGRPRKAKKDVREQINIRLPKYLIKFIGKKGCKTRVIEQALLQQFKGEIKEIK